MEKLLFSQLELNRSRTLEIAAGLTEREADVIPIGFNNNIRWHLGHILTTQERLALRLIQEPLGLPEELTRLFVNGTRPADWSSAPPELPELLKLLTEQPDRLRKRLEGRLEEKLTVPFKDFSQLSEALVFSIGHEAMHAGYMMALKRAVAAQEGGK